jgi:hypothetical protein
MLEQNGALPFAGCDPESSRCEMASFARASRIPRRERSSFAGEILAPGTCPIASSAS